MTVSMISRILFNCSLPKSGSEMLQAVLSQHPSIYAGQTSPVLELQKAARRVYSGGSQAYMAMTEEASEMTFSSVCAGIAVGFYEPLACGHPVVVDKNREWLARMNWAKTWTHNAAAVCLVRDLRSIVASFERTYRERGDRLFAAPPEDDYGKPIPLPESKRERLAFFLTKFPPLGPSLRWLKEAVALDQVVPFGENEEPVPMDAALSGGSDRPILCIRYEDFCADPGKWMERIYDHFMIDRFEEHDFKNLPPRPLPTEIPGGFGPFGNHHVAPIITPDVPDRFRDVLTEEDEMFIGSTMEWYFELFKYV